MLTIGDRFGPYDIEGTLGAGGMGVVYRARDPRLGREVAIKTLPATSATDPARLKRFEQEAQAAGALNHPNILAVYDVGDQQGTPYLVTELLEGETLRTRLRHGRIPPRKAIELTVQIAAGLGAVHEKGIVHRDLKPDNLFLTSDGRVKILDFGVARALETDTPPASQTLAITQSGAVMGTAGYMAPEQVRGKGVDFRADIFALGAILYEMLSGQMAFPGETPVERGYAILNEEPAELTGVPIPPALDRVMRRCLEKAPEERFQNAHDLAFALLAITDPSGRAEVLSTAVPRKLGRRVALAAGALLLLALGVGLGLRLKRPPAPPPERPSPTATRVSYRNGSLQAARFAGEGSVVYAGAFEGEPLQVYSGTIGAANLRSISGPHTELFAVSRNDEVAIGADRIEPGSEPGAVLSRLNLVGGAARPVLEGVVAADFTPDGSDLLVTRTTGHHWTIELPAGNVILSVNEQVMNARLSPRGDRIAFEQHPVPFDDRGHVEVVDLRGHSITRSHDAWTLRGLAWAPSGDEVWFTAADRSTQRSIRAVSMAGVEREVYRTPGTLVLHDVDAKGRALVSLELMRFRMFGKVGDVDHERALGWFDGSTPSDLSNDGKTLLFIEGFGATRSEIETWLRTFDGTPPVSISTGWGRALSPDKRWAVVSPEPPFTTLSIVPTGPGPARPLPDGGFTAIMTVRFFPDGKRLVISARSAEGKPRIFVQPLGEQSSGGPEAPVGGPQMLIDEDLELKGPPSPDGKWIAATQQKGPPVLIEVESGRLTPLPGLEVGDQPVQWSENGKALLLVRRATPGVLNNLSLRRYELKSGKLSEMMRLGPTDAVGIVAIRSGMATPDAKHYVYSATQSLADLYLIEGLR